MLQMIEILKVKREFLQRLLTLTQEKNVKLSRFPLIHLDEVEASLDARGVKDPITGEMRLPDERFLRAAEEKIRISDSGKQSLRQEVLRKAMVAFKAGERSTLASHARMREAIEQYLFAERRDALRPVTSSTRPDDEARSKISAVQQRMIAEHGYDEHGATVALNYVTTLVSQEQAGAVAGAAVLGPQENTVRVPVEMLEPHHFRLPRSGGQEGVGQGGMEFVLEFKVDEIVDFLCEEMRLPNLQTRIGGSAEETHWVFEGWDRRGARSRLDRRCLRARGCRPPSPTTTCASAN